MPLAPSLLRHTSTLRLGATTEQITGANTLAAALNEAYGLYSNPLTHTSVVMHNVSAVYQDSLGYWRGIRQQLKHNKTIELNDFDCQDLDIHRDKATRTPSKPLVYAPESLVTQRDYLAVQISSFKPATPEQNHHRLPQYARANGSKIAIVSHVSPAPAEADYQSLASVSRAVYKFAFTLAEEVMACNLITWRIGQRGGESPISPSLAF